MYHPTIFENLRVAFENHIYDLDNIDHLITIINRQDCMDFAILARSFSIEFILIHQQDVSAEIILAATLEELADEILEKSEINPGCNLLLRMKKHINDPSKQCKLIESVLNKIWEKDIELSQTLSFDYNQEKMNYLNNIEVKFNPKLKEDHMDEIPVFLISVLKSLEELNRI